LPSVLEGIVDDRIVLVPALVEAVRLEEEVAVFPRVILSGLCVGFMLDDLKNYVSAIASPWNDQLLLDADSRIFLNYLEGIAVDGIPGQIEAGLREHGRAVTKKLAKFPEGGRIREKYVWAAHYHNFVHAESFSEVGDYMMVDELTEIERRDPRQFSRIAR
jgi:hypothetical protein